jgi:DNA-directed RNA polymerase specialized sigma24 family protein
MFKSRFDTQKINQRFATLLESLNNNERGEFSEAFTSFWNTVKPLINRIVQRNTKSSCPHDIEDRVQEIALKLFNKRTLATYTECGNAAAWIAEVTRNLCLDLNRREGNSRQLRPDRREDLSSLDGLQCPKTFEPDQLASAKELRTNATQALRHWAGETRAHPSRKEELPHGDDFSVVTFQQFIANYFDLNGELPPVGDLATLFETHQATAKSRRRLARKRLVAALGKLIIPPTAEPPTDS